MQYLFRGRCFTFVGENVPRLVRSVLRELNGDYMQMLDVIVTPTKTG
jgi:hypothetical protein